jgi:hypothetical protein
MIRKMLLIRNIFLGFADVGGAWETAIGDPLRADLSMGEST